MRIEKLIFKNYRQFRDVEVSFKEPNKNDLHIVIGSNGTGKTNILNGINWCLYNEEPHLSYESQQLPVLNIKTISGSKANQDQETIVEVWVRSDDGRRITFQRKASFKTQARNKLPAQVSLHFEAAITPESGDTEFIEGEEAEALVDRFVPGNIREFFFFNGERLDTYFRKATKENVKNAVLRISQIDLLTRIERNLNILLKDLKREAGKAVPKIKELEEDYEKKEHSRDELARRVTEYEEQTSKADERIAELNLELKMLPDVTVLESEREEKDQQSKKERDTKAEKNREKLDLIFENSKPLILGSVIQEIEQMLKEKHESGEIPPNIKPDLLKSTLEECICEVCGSELTEAAKKKVTDLLKRIEYSTNIAQKLTEMESSLAGYRFALDAFSKSNKSLTKDIDDCDKRIKGLKKRIDEIDADLSGHDNEHISAMQIERKELEGIRDKNIESKGRLEGEVERLEKEMAEISDNLDKEMKKAEKIKNLTKEKNFCEAAASVAQAASVDIMKETKERIELKTKEIFFTLVWKKKTFKDVKIEDDYSVKLIHQMGYECLGTVGAAENELLVLAFTLALHEISGFDAPLLIDTPVARVSDANRTNFGKVLSGFDQDKQRILLFTPDEYSAEIAEVFSTSSASEQRLALSADESEVKVMGG